MVSVVVSIRTRKMFVEVRKMFLNGRYAEQDVRERQASSTQAHKPQIIRRTRGFRAMESTEPVGRVRFNSETVRRESGNKTAYIGSTGVVATSNAINWW